MADGLLPLAVRWVFRLLIVAAAAWGMVAVLVYLLQERFIYFPWRLSAEEARADAARRGLAPWPGDGGALRGFVAEPRVVPPRGTVLVLHGNAGHALHRLFYVDELAELGWRVVLLEYPGYGPRPGRPGERELVADALESVREANRRFGSPVVLAGESLGAGVAAAVAGKEPSLVSGLLLITPWDSLTDLGQRLYRFLPVRMLLRDRYDNVASLSAYPGPVVVVMAGQDEIIPAAHTRRLFKSVPGTKRLLVLPGVGHNDWPDALEREWWAEAADFLARDAVAPPHPSPAEGEP